MKQSFMVWNFPHGAHKLWDFGAFQILDFQIRAQPVLIL
jgi:hypothetical protein